MANDLNLCVFIGRLGRDVEIKYLESGTSVSNFSIAVNSKYKDNETTTWINLVAWGKLSEICSDYLGKGDQVQVTCRYQTRQYEDKEGNKRYNHEFVVQSMQMLGGGSSSGSSGDDNDDYQASDEDVNTEIPF